MPRSPALRDQEREPVAILQNIRDGIYDAGELLQESRRAVVLYLRHEGWRREAICKLLKISESTLKRDIAAAKKRMADGVTDLDVREIAGEHMARAEHIAGRLCQDKKWGEAWGVYRGLISDLQSLGLVVKQPQIIALAPPPEELAKLPDNELAAEMRRVLDVEFEVDNEFEGIPAPAGEGEAAPEEGEG